MVKGWYQNSEVKQCIAERESIVVVVVGSIIAMEGHVSASMGRQKKNSW